MKNVMISLLVTLATTMSFAKGDAAAGKTKSATCAACHGAGGISPNDLWPNLKGQKYGYMLQALKDYKSGKRDNPLMSPQAKVLSEKDMEDLAAYFSGL
ncbi:MAG: cytochrome c [Bdellovibrionales bacterium]|nr:cytochrome c [Bdellovibrionales bacterium]